MSLYNNPNPAKVTTDKDGTQTATMRIGGTDYTVQTSTSIDKDGTETVRTSIQSTNGAKFAAVSCMHDIPKDSRGFLNKLIDWDPAPKPQNGNIFAYDKLDTPSTAQRTHEIDTTVSVAVQKAVNRVFEDGVMTAKELQQLVALRASIKTMARDGIDEIEKPYVVNAASKVKGSDITRS